MESVKYLGFYSSPLRLHLLRLTANFVKKYNMLLGSKAHLAELAPTEVGLGPGET